MKTNDLTIALKAYGDSDAYPMHMPGHKRNPALLRLGEPCRIDITEIDGFDNLHEAEGILKAAMERAAALWGAQSTRYLVNGSTSGLLIALSALCPMGAEVIVARNCHLSVWYAMELRGLRPTCVMPPIEPNTSIFGALTPDLLEDAFARAPHAAAVVVTSPTYEGVVSDIAALSKVAHAHGAWLIVDEAHGAHLGFFDCFPKSAVKCGGDVVIQSLHKTLPALTQTALLHICSDQVPAAQIDRFSRIYQTSSPSYLLMASMDVCVRLLTEKADSLFEAYSRRLTGFYAKVQSMQKLHLVGGMGKTPAQRIGSFTAPRFDRDPGKLYISANGSGMTGRQLYDRLRLDYHIQPEMADGMGCLCMTSIADTDEGFERLSGALLAIDAELQTAPEQAAPVKPLPDLILPKRVCTPTEAAEQNGHLVPLSQVAGKVSAEFVYAYPPDSPLLAPGELVSAELIELFGALKDAGVKLHRSSSIGEAEDEMLLKVLDL